MRKLMTAVLASAGLTLIAGTAAVGIITATATPAPAPPTEEPAQTRVMIGADADPTAPAPAAPTPAPEATPATKIVVPFEYVLTPEEQAVVAQGDALPPESLVPDDLNAAIGQIQDRIVTACMAAQGFDYPAYAAAMRVGGDESVPRFEEWLRSGVDSTAFFAALWGEQTEGPYDWTQAGCDGYAVHITGMDDHH